MFYNIFYKFWPNTYFICHKLSIVQYKYYVDSNGRLPEKLVLIVLAAHYTFIISIVWIYRMTLNDPNPDFKGTPLCDTE